jgi:hypothetical protein
MSGFEADSKKTAIWMSLSRPVEPPGLPELQS